MKPNDAAYIAGLFDGEGTVTCKSYKRIRHDRAKRPVHNVFFIRCEIALTTSDAVTWVHQTAGYGWYREKKYYNRPAHYKRQWRWACGYRNALKFAKEIVPHSKIKKQDLQNIIDHYEKPKTLEG